MFWNSAKHYFSLFLLASWCHAYQLCRILGQYLRQMGKLYKMECSWFKIVASCEGSYLSFRLVHIIKIIYSMYFHLTHVCFVLQWEWTERKATMFSTGVFVPEHYFLVLFVFISVFTNKLSEIYYFISHSILDIKMSKFTTRSSKVSIKYV